mgnify:CR=1 FL=1
MECRRVCHVNGAAGHCRLVEGIPLLQLGEDVKLFNRRTACVTTRGLYRWLFWRMVVPYSIRATLAAIYIVQQTRSLCDIHRVYGSVKVITY